MRCSRHIMGNGSGGVHNKMGATSFFHPVQLHQQVVFLSVHEIYLIHHIHVYNGVYHGVSYYNMGISL